MAKEIKDAVVETPVPTVSTVEETTETPVLQGMENKPTYEELVAQLEAFKAYAEEQKLKPVVTAEQTTEEYLNERVPFRAFKDNDKYKDDIHVGINGYNFVIKRGITVKIPRYVLMVINDSDKQQFEADTFAETKSKKYADDASLLGID